jgi:hypothetical protein
LVSRVAPWNVSVAGTWPAATGIGSEPAPAESRPTTAANAITFGSRNRLQPLPRPKLMSVSLK